MMGRGAGWQYPQMLAKHYAATLKMSKANVVLIATVRLFASLQSLGDCAETGFPWGGLFEVCVVAAIARSTKLLLRPVLLCVLQWFERALDLVGLAAGAINIYVSKVRAGCMAGLAAVSYGAAATHCC